MQIFLRNKNKLINKNMKQKRNWKGNKKNKETLITNKFGEI
jgi:hypothetical protein